MKVTHVLYIAKMYKLQLCNQNHPYFQDLGIGATAIAQADQTLLFPCEGLVRETIYLPGCAFDLYGCHGILY